MTEIIFKRFPKDKQEQIRQFVSYAQMCGLSGKDIRSIGDKLDRDRKSEERKQNIAIVESFTCLPIGADARQERYGKNHFQQTLDGRFKLKMANGDYNFKSDYNGWDIRSLSTGVVRRYNNNYDGYELSYSMGWQRRCRYSLLLDISFGKLRLDF